MSKRSQAGRRQLHIERKEVLLQVRKTILMNLPAGYVETMQLGMISYVVPLSKYPDTYNGQPLMLAALGSQMARSRL